MSWSSRHEQYIRSARERIDPAGESVLFLDYLVGIKVGEEIEVQISTTHVEGEISVYDPENAGMLIPIILASDTDTTEPGRSTWQALRDRHGASIRIRRLRRRRRDARDWEWVR